MAVCVTGAVRVADPPDLVTDIVAVGDSDWVVDVEMLTESVLGSSAVRVSGSEADVVVV